MNQILPILIFLPLLAAVAIALVRSTDGKAARWGSLAAGLLTLGLSLVAAGQYLSLSPVERLEGPVQPRLEYRQTWLTLPFGEEGASLEFFVGVDGVSLLLVVLSSLLTVAAILISWKETSGAFFACLLALLSGLIGAFCAFDLLLFYVFFEFTLIPLYFLIGLWGGPDRAHAARRYVIYTLTASLATLVGIVAVGVAGVTEYKLATPFSIPDLAVAMTTMPLPWTLQSILFVAIAIGFAVKTPLVPLHTWQPLVYVEAPTGASVLLAGAVMKLGTYGFFRLCVTLFPEASLRIGVPLIGGLAVAGIIYASLCALAQRDIKRLVAYSSISHIGFCLLGLFAFNSEGLSGGVLQMVNHGLSTGALFLLVGMIYERYQTRSLTELGGLASRLPLLATCMVFIALASIGLPGLNGFVGEFLSLAGMFLKQPVYAALGTLGVVLGAWYTLGMIQQGFFGPLKEPARATAPRDMNVREGAVVVPLMALCLWIGVYPAPLLKLIEPDVARVAALYGERPRVEAQAELQGDAENALARTAEPQTPVAALRLPNNLLTGENGG